MSVLPPIGFSILILLLLAPPARATGPCVSTSSASPLPLPVAAELSNLTHALAFPDPSEVGSMDGLFLFDVTLGAPMDGEPLQLRPRRMAEPTEVPSERFALIRSLARELADGQPAPGIESLKLQERLLLLSTVSGTLPETAIRRIRSRMGFESVPAGPIPLFRERESGELFGQVGGAVLKFGFITDERARSASSRILARHNTDAAASVWNPRTAQWLSARAEGRTVPTPAQVTLELGRADAPSRDVLAGLGDTRAWRTEPGPGRVLEGVIAPREALAEGRRSMEDPLSPLAGMLSRELSGPAQGPGQASQQGATPPASKDETPWLKRAGSSTNTPVNVNDPDSYKKVLREKGWKPVAEDHRRGVAGYLRDQGLFVRDFKVRTSDFPSQFGTATDIEDSAQPTGGRSDFGPIVTRLRDTTFRVSQALPSAASNREVSSSVKLDPFKGTTATACVTDDFNRGQERFSTCTERNRDYGGKRETRFRVDSTMVRARETLDLRLGAAAEIRREDSTNQSSSARSATLHASANTYHPKAPGPVRLFSNFIWDFPVNQGQSKAILRQEVGARSCDRMQTCLEIGLRHQAGSQLMEIDPVTQSQRPARSLYLTYTRTIF